jgi:hypothetical protein
MGTTTYVLTLDRVTPETPGQTVVVRLDHDGRKVVRAAAGAGPWGQSWHEVDARGLKTVSADGIEGELILVLNRDKWQMKRTPTHGVAGRIQLTAARRNGALTGAWSAVWGETYSFTGAVTGQRQATAKGR